MDISGHFLSGNLPASRAGSRNLQDFNIANNKSTRKIFEGYGPFQDDDFAFFTDLTRNMLLDNLMGKLPNFLPLPR